MKLVNKNNRFMILVFLFFSHTFTYSLWNEIEMFSGLLTMFAGGCAFGSTSSSYGHNVDSLKKLESRINQNKNAEYNDKEKLYNVVNNEESQYAITRLFNSHHYKKRIKRSDKGMIASGVTIVLGFTLFGYGLYEHILQIITI